MSAPPAKGGFVILDCESYMDEMKRIILNVDTYSVLPSNPTFKFKKDLQTIVDRGYQTKNLN